MAWTTPVTWTNAVLTAAQLNAQVKDNMNETAVAKASAAGQYFVATGVNVLAARAADADVLDSIASTASTTYVSSGMPTVTVNTSVEALVAMFSYVNNNTNSQSSFYGFVVSGATTAAANDNRALTAGRFTSDFAVVASAVVLASTTAGSNTFTAAVRVTGGTGTWDHRRLAIVPF